MAFKLTSTGKLKEELQRRASEMAGRTAAARLTVPEELHFWYYQEFGTATHAERGTDNPQGYDIDPSEAGGIRLPMTGAHSAPLLIPHVGPNITRPHPGVEPKHMVTRVLDDIRNQTSDVVVLSMHEGNYTFDAVRNALVNEAMPLAKEAITVSFEEQLPGQRTDPQGAKLPGTAAEAFEQGAEIVDVSE